MGIITDISRQKRNTSRVNIYVDGEFVCGLDEVAAAAARLKVGAEVTPERLAEIAERSEYNSAFDRAVGYISYAPRASSEIRRYLTDKGYARETVGKVLERLKEYRYIDDRAYAKAYISGKASRYGKMRLRAELAKRGIAADIISELLEDSGDGDDGENGYDEVGSAKATAVKYMRSHSGAVKPKLKAYLAGRGYTWDSINAAVRELERDGLFSDGDDTYDDD